jgi:hyperosmotically inducible protein
MDKPIKQHTTQRKYALSTLGALLAATALVGCQRHDPATTADRSADSTVAQADRKMDTARSDVAAGAHNTREAARETGQDVRQDAKAAADAIGDKVSDAVITTSVNGELAKDSKLSAMKINVDTSSGNVSLYGTAPDEAARERATQLAANVKGVHKVDNQLQVAPK